MALTFTLVEQNAFRTRWLAVSDGVAGVGTIPNAAGLSPDLRSDTLGQSNGLVQTLVVSQAAARELLAGEGLVGPTQQISRGHLFPVPRTGSTIWSTDANLGVGPSAGFAVVDVTASVGVAGDSAYVELFFNQAIDRTAAIG